MINKGKTITVLPLTTLLVEEEKILATREKHLNKEDIRQILKLRPVRFVIADIGNPLLWIKLEECYNFWKSGVIDHIADNPDRVIPYEFPDSYAYLASEWTTTTQVPVVLLEKYH